MATHVGEALQTQALRVLKEQAVSAVWVAWAGWEEGVAWAAA